MMNIQKLKIFAPKEEYWGDDFNNYRTSYFNNKKKNKQSKYLYSFNEDYEEHDEMDVSYIIDKAFQEVNDDLGYEFFSTKAKKLEIEELKKKEIAEKTQKDMNEISQTAQELISQIKKFSFEPHQK